MFLGRFLHTIDDKGRITIPAKFRGRLAAGLVVTKGIDPCLWLYPIDGWDELAAKITALSRTNRRARDFRRQVFGDASDSVPDKQGRVNLPDYLREYANIDNGAVIVGLFDHCEIWNPEEWQKRQDQTQSEREERAAQFESLDI